MHQNAPPGDPAAFDELILVDEHDNPIGYETKLRAHQDGGRLHRAFSVFIFNRAGEIGGWEWASPEKLLADVRARPARYTPWFGLAVERVLAER